MWLRSEKKMFHNIHYLPPLEPSDIIEVKKVSKRLVFSVLGVIIIIAVLGIYSVSGTDEPEPIFPISITNVTTSDSSGKCEIHFILINSGDKDGFAVVEMYGWIKVESDDGRIEGEGIDLLDKDRFFVKTNTKEEKFMESERVPHHYCSQPLIFVEIVEIE